MSDPAAEFVCDDAIDFVARAVIAQHGPRAAYAAEHHLDQLVRCGSPRSETWSAVIDAIHILRCRLGAEARAKSGPDQLRRLAAPARYF